MPRPDITTAEFDELLATIAEAQRDDLPRLLGLLRQAEAEAMLRLQAPAPNPAANPERLLTVQEAAERLRCSPDWLYRHSKQLPFARRTDFGLRFLESGLDSYLRRK